jgi:hypothetical protein
MANKYLDYSGVQTLWNAIKDQDNAVSASKAGYIHYDESGKVIQLWASEEDFNIYNAAADKTDATLPKPLSAMSAEAFVKDGMLHDVKITPAKEVPGGISYVAQGSTEPQVYNGDELFIEFVWNTDGESKKDYILLTDIAPIYTEGEGIDITNNKISFESGKSNQITMNRSIKLGGTPLANLLIEAGITSINANTNLTDVLSALLSVESWPVDKDGKSSLKTGIDALSISNPGPVLKGYTSLTGSTTASASVEVGTKVYLDIYGVDATAAASRSYSGFTYGYSEYPASDSRFEVKSGNPATVNVDGNEVADGTYSISINVPEGSYIGAISGLAGPNKTAADVKLSSRHEFTVNDGEATVDATQTTPNFTASLPATKTYYGLSTLENTSDDYKIEGVGAKELNANSTSKTNTYKVTGFRKLFYGSFDVNDLSLLTAENIRKAVGGGSTTSAPTSGTYNIAAKGKYLAWIAFPDTYKWKVTKSLVDGVDLSDFYANWQSTTVSVGGVNGYNPINYTVWYADGGTSGWTGEKLNVTIG